jgi:hypothetical protein
MSSVSRSPVSAVQFNRVEELKNDLVQFATKGPLKDEYEIQRKLFFEAAQPEDEHDTESVLDWFLFDWYDEDGDSVIVRYLDREPNLAEAERKILIDWQDSINSVFEVGTAGKGSVQLRDLESGDVYTVRTRSQESPFKRGQFIIARLLPLGNNLIFSGLQFLMPDKESALAWLEMRRAFDDFDTPEAIEKARREQVAAFCDLFGCDELTVSSGNLSSTLQRFERYLLTERRDPDTGLTPAERYKKELGQELSVPDLPALPAPFASAGEVTILCDDFDGIVLLPDYTRFRRVFETEEPDRHVPDWKELVWSYVKDPDIPTVAFERVAEHAPQRVERVLRSLIGDKDFSIEHLYAVLLHYKQPVDGLEDLKDDQDLWDLFNGNSTPAKPVPAPSKKKSNQARTKKANLQKASVKPKAKLAARKTSPAARPATSKRKPAAKLARKSSAKSKAVKETPRMSTPKVR